MAEEMSFEEVTRIYREESGRRNLFPLQPNFYERLDAYIEELRTKYEKEAEKDFHSSQTLLSREEFVKAMKKREQIYRLRERKISLLASTKASGATVDTSSLSKPELSLFGDLVAILRKYRESILSWEKIGTKIPKENTPLEKVSRAKKGDAYVLEILEDIPTFAGIDTNYALRKDDVATLPKEMAEVLIKSGKARRIEIPDDKF